MLPSEIDTIITNWNPRYAKVFTIKYAFAEPDILVITKVDDNTFRVDAKCSTTDLFEIFDKDTLVANLRNGTMVFRPDYNEYLNYRYIATKGCECGAWKTNYPEFHATYCPKHPSKQEI